MVMLLWVVVNLATSTVLPLVVAVYKKHMVLSSGIHSQLLLLGKIRCFGKSSLRCNPTCTSTGTVNPGPVIRDVQFVRVWITTLNRMPDSHKKIAHGNPRFIRILTVSVKSITRAETKNKT